MSSVRACACNGTTSFNPHLQLRHLPHAPLDPQALSKVFGLNVKANEGVMKCYLIESSGLKVMIRGCDGEVFDTLTELVQVICKPVGVLTSAGCF
jgi:hypothetical protein